VIVDAGSGMGEMNIPVEVFYPRDALVKNRAMVARFGLLDKASITIRNNIQ
jgi:hypothetical protein